MLQRLSHEFMVSDDSGSTFKTFKAEGLLSWKAEVKCRNMEFYQKPNTNGWWCCDEDGVDFGWFNVDGYIFHSSLAHLFSVGSIVPGDVRITVFPDPDEA